MISVAEVVSMLFLIVKIILMLAVIFVNKDLEKRIVTQFWFVVVVFLS